MRPKDRYQRLGRSARLWRRTNEEPPSYWTEALAGAQPVYGERLVHAENRWLRRWEPNRSKLGAAIAKGWTEPLPQEGERWLYLGAASGTTASHIADLVGPAGSVYAVEKSLRPFARLLRLAERYPNLAPVLDDARRISGYLGLVPPVDGLYVDVAQPDQVEIALENARTFLRERSSFLLVLKTASMGRDRSPREHLESAIDAMHRQIEVEEEIALDPFHRKHYLIGGRPGRALFRPVEAYRARPPFRNRDSRVARES
ncbi:MAG: fibrillarin-like rRNA/tRNA 2'-O-methyltransferase [Thermoplasmata archaeon]|nr:fibrillarin-like rRNA/tRNA 2'-O-methyltransferase [Thermoplasmata archaeon]